MSYQGTGVTITEAQLNNLKVLAKAVTYTALGTDDVILGTSTWTLTLYAANLNQDGATFQRTLVVINDGVGIITVQRGGADTFADGTTTFDLAPGQGCILIPDGTSKWAVLGSTAFGTILRAPELKNYVETFTAPTIVTTTKTISANTTVTNTISANTLANPTVVQTSAPHNRVSGDSVTITGSNSTPSINGTFTITVIDTTHFSIPVAVTVAGTAGTATWLATIITTTAAHGWIVGNVVEITGSNSTPSINGVFKITEVLDTTHVGVQGVVVTVAGTAGTIAQKLLTLDLSTGSEFDVALNANITEFAFTNVPSSTKVTTVTVRFTADGTQRTITWPTSFRWPLNVTPTMSSTNTKVDIITARTYNGGTAWFPAIYGQNA